PTARSLPSHRPRRHHVAQAWMSKALDMARSSAFAGFGCCSGCFSTLAEGNREDSQPLRAQGRPARRRADTPRKNSAQRVVFRLEHADVFRLLPVAPDAADLVLGAKGPGAPAFDSSGTAGAWFVSRGF